MTVTKKIQKELEKYIEDGALVRSDKHQEQPFKSICLRMEVDFLLRIDNMVRRRVGMSRNAWILEAINEKLEKE